MPIQYTQKALEQLKKLREDVENLRNKEYSAPEVTAFFTASSHILEEIFDYKTAVEISNEFFRATMAYNSNQLLVAYNRQSGKIPQEPYDKLAARLVGLIKTVEFGLCVFSANDSKIHLRNQIEDIQRVMNRFDIIFRQLRHRHNSRETLDISDEYDVQDLFHALLKLYFDDIRAEEWTPSYAGSSSRIDFFIPELELAIEIKKTRKGLGNKEAKEQLAIDKDHYRCKENIKHLICFVYDPDGRIQNPRGFEKDLAQEGPLKTDVYVRP